MIAGEKKDVNVQKEVLQATAECTRVFIHYLVNAANDICQENRRQNVSSDDVLKALEEAEFSEYQEPIRTMLQRAPSLVLALCKSSCGIRASQYTSYAFV